MKNIKSASKTAMVKSAHCLDTVDNYSKGTSSQINFTSQIWAPSNMISEMVKSKGFI